MNTVCSNNVSENLTHIGIEYKNYTGQRADIFRLFEMDRPLMYFEGRDNEKSYFVCPWMATPEILSNFWFVKDKNNIYYEFKDKHVTDIGSWFSRLGFELETSVSKINLVDPLYGDILSLDQKLQYLTKNMRDINRLYHRYLWVKDRTYIKQPLPESFIKRENSRADNLNDTLTGLNIWKENLCKENSLVSTEKVILNSSSGESIIWIEDNSQDYVFINFVLDKEDVDPYLVLSEASRILKSWGKIFSLNNDREAMDIFLKSQWIVVERNNRILSFELTKK